MSTEQKLKNVDHNMLQCLLICQGQKIHLSCDDQPINLIEMICPFEASMGLRCVCSNIYKLKISLQARHFGIVCRPETLPSPAVEDRWSYCTSGTVLTTTFSGSPNFRLGDSLFLSYSYTENPKSGRSPGRLDYPNSVNTHRVGLKSQKLQHPISPNPSHSEKLIQKLQQPQTKTRIPHGH